jgi:hypothetical protein
MISSISSRRDCSNPGALRYRLLVSVTSGPLAGLFGVQAWFLLGGVLTALMGIGGYFIPAINKIEEGRNPSGSPEGLRLTPPTPGD